MRKKHSKRLGAMTRSLVASLLLLPALFMAQTASGELVTRKMVVIQFELYSNEVDVQTACKATRPLGGCTYNLGRGQFKVVTLAPMNFCDWAVMKTLGHEVMHGLGYMHATDYILYTGDPDLRLWTGANCGFVK